MAKKARTQVLIVNNFPLVTKQLNYLFGLIENVEVVNQVKTAEDALEIIRMIRPDVAVIDVDLPDMNGTNFTEMVRRDFPLTQVIVTCQNSFANTVLQAMRNGAVDFFTHDVTLEELSPAIKRAEGMIAIERQKLFSSQVSEELGGSSAVPSTDRSDGKIISIYSTKGGAGVTTLAINLAIALQDSESSIALVDASMQFGDVAILLNEISVHSILDLIPRIYNLDDQIIRDVMIKYKASGLHLMTAPPRPELAEKVTGQNMSLLLEYLRGMYDYIVINNSSYITDVSLSALESSEIIVLLLTQEIASIKNTRSFLGLWNELGVGSDRILLVINRYNKQNKLTTERISDSLKSSIAEVIPLDDETVQRSTNLGIPFMLDRKDLPITKAVRSIAEQVKKRVAEVEPGERARLAGKI